ncbi:hypothetical protein C1H46_005462 [Malus baccata]|uniref:Uncharacterized protein n=1 Tax=Malus baccata TaxID=106549 RepID=A0A540NDG0_MALBA|nr:hypothetical protein C1H46_005462 [Malus baccata]
MKAKRMSCMERLQRMFAGVGGVLGHPPSDSPTLDSSEQDYISPLAFLKMLKHEKKSRELPKPNTMKAKRMSCMERLQRMFAGVGGVLGHPPSDSPTLDSSEQDYISPLAFLKMLKHGKAFSFLFPFSRTLRPLE